jgi:hypothetical protein
MEAELAAWNNGNGIDLESWTHESPAQHLLSKKMSAVTP